MKKKFRADSEYLGEINTKKKFQFFSMFSFAKWEHSVEEVLERPTGYPKVGGSNHGSGDFSLQPQRIAVLQ